MTDLISLSRGSSVTDSVSSSSALSQNYRELVCKSVDLIKSGSTVSPSSTPIVVDAFCASGDSQFEQLALEQRRLIVEGLKQFISLTESAVAAGIDLYKETHEAAWWVIRSLGWRPTSDVFSLLAGSNIVEIYDAQHVQLFRSFTMFKFISYSLDELMTYEWSKLYRRPEGVEDRIMAAILKSMREARTVTKESGEKHMIAERFSPRRRKAMYEPIAVSPLLSKNNRVVGYINLIRVSPLEN